jgi:hypothetical protein
MGTRFFKGVVTLLLAVLGSLTLLLVLLAVLSWNQGKLDRDFLLLGILSAGTSMVVWPGVFLLQRAWIARVLGRLQRLGAPRRTLAYTGKTQPLPELDVDAIRREQ